MAKKTLAHSERPTGGRPRIKSIHTLDRLPNSKDDNPRYRVYFTDGTHMDTKADAAVNYSIGNPENVAPFFIKVWTEKSHIIYVEPVANPTGD